MSASDYISGDTAGYALTFDMTRVDVREVHAFLTTTYWSTGVPLDVVQRALANSLCIAALHEGQVVAFARMVTDRATFAYLADVFVLPEHRGRELSKRLMERLLAHPDLQGLRRMLLATRDAHGLYAQYGFTPLAAPDRFMEKHDAQVYARASA